MAREELKIDDAKKQRIIAMWREGGQVDDIKSRFGISKSELYNILKKRTK